jgi:Ca2+-binding EF-hand superfamily protein
VKNVLFGAIAAVFLAIAPVTPAKADMSDLEILFVDVDQDGDLVLNKGEVLLIAIRQFNLSDSDRDGMLEKQEVGELASDPEFSDNDANKDGALSIEEVITEKLADFKSADTNSDGVLTVIEVTKFYENKK